MDQDWSEQSRDKRTDSRRFGRNHARFPATIAQSPCANRGSTWLTRGQALFKKIWLGLLQALRLRGIDADDAEYHAAVNADVIQVTKRGNGCAICWPGAGGYWWVALRSQNRLADQILRLPA